MEKKNLKEKQMIEEFLNNEQPTQLNEELISSDRQAKS